MTDVLVIEESDTETVDTGNAVLSLLADASDTDGAIGSDRISIAVGAEGARHAFGAAPGYPVDLLVIATPGVERFAYFRLLPAILRNEFSQEQLDELHAEYDVHFEDSPEWTATRHAKMMT